MTFPISYDAISAGFVGACEAELSALKPGNVHVYAAGHGMEVQNFVDAARAAAPFVADPSLSLGIRIERAVDASFAVAGCNTNLGILLLCVPLAVAAGEADGPADLRGQLSAVLARLGREDAAAAFRAITRANPAGLGRADTGDVAGEATITLREAMSLAADRDRIARAYITDFDEIFGFGLPRLYAARRASATPAMGISALHMAYLSTFLDSHVERKHGRAAAEAVREDARKTVLFLETAAPDEALQALLLLDFSLKERGLNPGTTADFVVATLYAEHLIAQSATRVPA
ncbi:MAG: triphosphoribosyl-dephospho-CoA synthase [Hyphomicrobium sp.]|jgi:triphosphoribosyl-dephospho-CoA synthase